jgi:HD superfamily phosphodiesterase
MNDKKHKEKDKHKEHHKKHSEYEMVEHSEGMVARAIERRTAKLPSDLFLWAALGSIGASMVLEVTGNTEKAHWVGQWVAPFLLLGLYNKIVKVAGSDRMTAGGV